MLQLLLALSSVDEWSYDAFCLEEASGGRPLSALSFALFKRSGIVSCLKLNESKLARSVHEHLCIYRDGSAMQEGGQGGIVSCLKLNESKLARSVHGHFCVGKEAHCMQEGGL